MIVIATVGEIGYADSDYATQDWLVPIPIGALIDVPSASLSGVVSLLKNRFPVPDPLPLIHGYAIDPDEELTFSGLVTPYHITSALHPEGSYLEPTIGQIWPRIG